MDLEREVTAFIDWLETNPLEPSAQSLWMHLMAIANKSGYPEWFAVANPLLQAKVGISENTLSKHRNYLVQKGRIEYRSQGKQRAGKYRMILFTAENEVKHDVKHEVEGAVKHAIKGSGINNTLSSTSSTETFYAAYQRAFNWPLTPFQKQQLEAYIEEGLNESVVIRAIERAAFKGKGHNFPFLLKIVDDYFKSGVQTVEQALAIDAEYDRGKNSGTRTQGKKVISFADMAKEAVSSDTGTDR